MTEKRIPPIVGEWYARQAPMRRERDRLVEGVVRVARLVEDPPPELVEALVALDEHDVGSGVAYAG